MSALDLTIPGATHSDLSASAIPFIVELHMKNVRASMRTKYSGVGATKS
jgi:hypothetical protein